MKITGLRPELLRNLRVYARDTTLQVRSVQTLNPATFMSFQGWDELSLFGYQRHLTEEDTWWF